MTKTPLTLPAGVVATPTKKSRSANWADANLVRWEDGKLTPIGGWERIGYTAPASKIRAIHTWTLINGQQCTAYLCEGHCYVDTGDGVLLNISPTTAITPPGALSAGGYGDNVYSYGDYGTARPDVDRPKPITPGYYIDNWGQNLLVMTSTDGRLLMWDPTTPGYVLEPVANAPTANRAFVVTKQRHVMLFSAGGVFNRFAWCSQEDIENWSYTDVTKTAGFYDIEPASPIITACAVGNEVVFWAASGDMYVARYIGVPFVYSYEAISEGGVPLSPMSVCATPNGAIWVSSDGVWKYEASTVEPVYCPIWTWVTENYNDIRARYSASIFQLNTKSEVWWLFPDANNEENTRAIIWNYKEGWWTKARIRRTCGSSSSYTTFPIMSNGLDVFKHESGFYYNTQGEETYPWATTFTLNAEAGVILATCMPMLPDITGQVNGVDFELSYTIPRAGGAERLSGRKMVGPGGYVPFRDTGRDFRLTVRQRTNGIGPWTVGECLTDFIGRGDK